MFQNINVDTGYIDENEIKTKRIKQNFIKENLSKQNIILYLISFMVSTVQFGNGLAPFAIAIIAAMLSNNIPIIITYLLTCIGTFIGFGGSGLLIYILTSLILVAFSIFLTPKIDESTNQKNLTPHLIVSCFIVQVLKIMMGPVLIYDVLLAVVYTIVTVIFYKIFLSSVLVIKESKIKKAFSIEEIIGTSLMVAIAVSAFKDITIFNYSVRNILSVFIVLFLGWQNGMLIGATSGVIIGSVIAVVQNGDPILIAAFAISGMIAGLLNKIGKIGVIIGFILGTVILTYVANGNTESIIMIQEILIASIGLLATPKNIKINIEDMFDHFKYLPKAPTNRLEPTTDMAYKLNNVSNAISEVAKSYKEAAATVLEDEEIEEERNKEIFVTELENNIADLKDNVIYDDLINEDSPIVNDIFKFLIDKNEINVEQLIKIFENHNNYILGFDDSELSKKIKEEIEKMVKAINSSYRISKLNFIWKKKIIENKEAMGTQLDGISKTISDIAEGINKDLDQENVMTEKEKIKKLLEQKNIIAEDINIKKQKNNKLEVTLYVKPCNEYEDNNSLEVEECLADKIRPILSKFFKQELDIQLVECAIQNDKEICYFKYTSKNKYSLQIGLAKTTKMVAQ